MKPHTIGYLWAMSKILKAPNEFMDWLKKEGYGEQEIEKISQHIDRAQNYDKTLHFGGIL